MIDDEFIKCAKEMVENNNQIIGLYFKLSPSDKLLFNEKVQKVVTNTHKLINKTFTDDQLRNFPA